MLDAHPELAIGPETQFVPDLIHAAIDAIVEVDHRGPHAGATSGSTRMSSLAAAAEQDLAGVLRPSTRSTPSLRASRGGARRRLGT